MFLPGSKTAGIYYCGQQRCKSHETARDPSSGSRDIQKQWYRRPLHRVTSPLQWVLLSAHFIANLYLYQQFATLAEPLCTFLSTMLCGTYWAANVLGNKVVPLHGFQYMHLLYHLSVVPWPESPAGLSYTLSMSSKQKYNSVRWPERLRSQSSKLFTG